jgi:hypothetical protein
MERIKTMKYGVVISTPRIESEYSDEYETTMVIDLVREDGAIGDVWIVAGVPDYLRGSSDAARTQAGYTSVRVFGDDVDMWCPESFRVADEDGHYQSVAEDVLAACAAVALGVHRQAMRDREIMALELAAADEKEQAGAFDEHVGPSRDGGRYFGGFASGDDEQVPDAR